MLLVVLASGGMPARRITETDGLTAAVLIVTAIFAVLVVIGILYGARQKRIRAAGEEEEKRRAAELAAQDETPVAVAPEPTPPPASTPTPPPPPPPPAEPTPPKAETPVAAKPEPKQEPKPRAAPKPKATTKTAPAEPAAKTKAAPNPRAKPAAAAPEPAASEPVAPPPPPAPATAPAPTPAPAPAGYALTDVKGLGPKAATLLTGLGIADVAALAALDPARAAEVDGQLGNFAGRLTRDRWVEQAKLLAAGDIATFEATYGKL